MSTPSGFERSDSFLSGLGTRTVSGGGLLPGGVPGLPPARDLIQSTRDGSPDPIQNPKDEAKRVMKRLSSIAADHVRAAARMGVNPEDLQFPVVIDWLRQHARGGSPTLATSGNEILDYLHQALIDDLLLEPANILLATPTGPDSIRYDAMSAAFWLECLDLFESSLH